MRRISSASTWYYKRALPLFIVAFLALHSLGVVSAVMNGREPRGVLMFPIVCAAIAYISWRLLVRPQSDKVCIDHDDVIVRNKGQEDRFPITNIVRVKSLRFRRPESIILTLRMPCKFGKEVQFIPKGRWVAIRPHPIAKELSRR